MKPNIQQAKLKLIKWWDDIGHFYISHSDFEIILKNIQDGGEYFENVKRRGVK